MSIEKFMSYLSGKKRVAHWRNRAGANLLVDSATNEVITEVLLSYRYTALYAGKRYADMQSAMKQAEADFKVEVAQ